MDDKTLKALQGSIAKYQADHGKLVKLHSQNKPVVSTRLPDSKVRIGWYVFKYSAWNCPLCKLCGKLCTGCPVKAKTKQEDCYGTPYHNWEAALYKHSEREGTILRPIYGGIKELKDCCKAELDFLTSLLPESTP